MTREERFIYLFIICGIALLIGTVLQLILPSESPLDNAIKDLDSTIAEVELAMSASLQREMFAWDVVRAVLNRAWQSTWTDGVAPLPTTITAKYQCWHVAALDGQVDDVPFEAWRCEFVGDPCDPRFVDLCIVLGGDGTFWEIRFDDEEVFTLHID